MSPKEHSAQDRPDALYLIGLLKSMALADGTIDPKEERLIRRVGANNGMSQAALDQLFQSKETHFSRAELRKLPYDSKFEILYNLLLMMKVDDVVMNEEVSLAHKIATHLGFQMAALMELYPHAHPNVREPEALSKAKKRLKQLLLGNSSHC